jgi:ATP-binding cassette subfamily F protein 3
LFSEPDLLLLDEPTNYLDLEGTLWLQDHLARYPRTVIVISHDRDLLDTRPIRSAPRSDQAHALQGHLLVVREQRATREMLDAKHAKRQMRAQAVAGLCRSLAAASKARQAQSRVKMLER